MLTSFYMLPLAIAATRSKRNIGPIVLINVFLGWTFVGWVAALVMACVNDPQPTFVAAVTTGPYGYPPAPYGYPPQQRYHQYPAQQYPPQQRPGHPPYPQLGYAQHALAAPQPPEPRAYQQPNPQQYHQSPSATRPYPTTPPTYGHPDDDQPTTQLPEQR